MQNSVKKYLKDLKTLCKENKVKIEFIPRYSFKEDGVETGGSFGGIVKMKLRCAKRRQDWLNLLIHEASHLDQYLFENEKMWVLKGDSYDKIDPWLKFKKVSNIHQHINNVQDLELDCEKRAVSKIKKYNLPIDISEYIQRANAYVYFFSYLKVSRKWPIAKKAAHAQKNIWQHMPKNFQKSYRKLPKKYIEIFNQYL